MTLIRLEPDAASHLVEPSLVAALDGWVDAGSAATVAAEQLAAAGRVVARFDNDQLYDYRSRRPTLDIVDGRLTELTWPELTIRAATVHDRDLLVLSGPEPDDRWRALAVDLVDLADRLGVVEWISLGAIPAAVPHTRPVPVLGTEAQAGQLRGNVRPGPIGRLRVPSATISVLEMAFADAGLSAVGYFAQVPHYVNGPYPAASLELLRAVGAHLGIEPPLGELSDEARQIRTRLDSATAVDDVARTYVERLEAMADEERLPAGDDLIADIEKYLRERGGEGTQRT
ncbi:MAG TPA: PAC2 family protein [Vitreimonas sp.]|nr:PAC2 family protein [Vitreimonas sp.]